MHTVLNKVFKGIVVRQMGDGIIIHYLQNRLWRNGFFAGCTLIHTFTRICHLSKQSTMHKPTLHFVQKYSVLPLLFLILHTWQQHCFPFEGQCWECFTSRRLIWDTDGLGLLRDTPLEVTLCSWDSV